MTIRLNGHEHQLADGTTVAELLLTLTGSGRGSAVAVDDVVVPRGQWPQAVLRDGQNVELITAVQGG